MPFWQGRPWNGLLKNGVLFFLSFDATPRRAEPLNACREGLRPVWKSGAPAFLSGG
jgi:hypothetical protein